MAFTEKNTLLAEKKSVALRSLIASAIMVLGKFVAGVLTGSLGLISEAVHSLLDFISTVITWLAVGWSEHPPDDEHPFGHGKIEALAALIETALLFITVIWIAYEAIERLFFGKSEAEVTWWSMAILVASIVIDFNRAHALQHVADKTGSEALEADALHFSSDMWSSLSVLIGLGFVWLGVPSADPISALIVAILVIIAGWKLGKRAIASLIDTAPEGATEAIRKILENFDGIIGIKHIRIRKVGPTVFASIHVTAARTLPIDEMGRIKQEIIRQIQLKYPNADIIVIIDPIALDNETIQQKIMLIANHARLDIHHLAIQQTGERLLVSFDLEVEGTMPLMIAHTKASQLEESIAIALGNTIDVESHIEPQPTTLLESYQAPEKQARPIISLLHNLAKSQKQLHKLQNVVVRTNRQGLFVLYHCHFSSTDTVEDVHDILDKIEIALKKKYPTIRRVIAHAEPLPT